MVTFLVFIILLLIWIIAGIFSFLGGSIYNCKRKTLWSSFIEFPVVCIGWVLSKL